MVLLHVMFEQYIYWKGIQLFENWEILCYFKVKSGVEQDTPKPILFDYVQLCFNDTVPNIASFNIYSQLSKKL